MNKSEWQNSSNPQAPKGYVIACTGCRDCEKYGHIPMPKRTP